MRRKRTPRADARYVLSPLSSSALVALLIVASPAGADLRLWAQDEYPADIFATLVLEYGYGADQARSELADRYGVAVATELAAYWCSPEPGPGCEGSAVLDAWLTFENIIINGYSADQAGAELAQYDESLAIAIAVYWCSPDPGTGCDGTEVLDVWLRFDDLMMQGYPSDQVLADLAGQYGWPVTEALAAYACGDLVCAQDDQGYAVAEQPMPEAGAPDPGSGKKNKYPKKRRGGRPGG